MIVSSSLTCKNDKSWQSYDDHNRVKQDDESGKKGKSIVVSCLIADYGFLENIQQNTIPEKHVVGPPEPGDSMNGEDVCSIIAPLQHSPFSWATDILSIRPPMKFVF